MTFCSRRSTAAVTMFKFFKRSASPPARPAGKPASRPPSSSASAAPASAAPHEPAPLPEVVEGNEHTDWALWEDSMAVLDSQMQELAPSARIYERDRETPSQVQDLDPFGKISKNSP